MDKSGILKLNDLLSSKYRLAVMRMLAGGDEYGFQALKNELGLTDGNLSSHMAKLEKGGLVKVIKGYDGKKPKTAFRITKKGLSAYRDYLDFLSFILREEQ